MSPLTALTQFFTGSRSSKPSRRKAPSRRLGVESLEKRQVMAGNVFVMHGNNALNIFGDTQDNQISVIETRPGVVQVSGLGNTTVNGRSGFVRFKNPSDNLNIMMQGGNDQVVLGKLGGATSRFNNVNVSMGAGRDSIVVNNTATYGHDFSSFNLGDEYENDNDRMEVNRCDFRKAAIYTGGGSDRVYSTNSTIETGLINTGSGHDYVSLSHTRSNDLYVSLGDGDDWFDSWNSRPIHTRWVHGGNGWDGFGLGGEPQATSATSEFVSFDHYVQIR